jgi:hypothetical protein
MSVKGNIQIFNNQSGLNKEPENNNKNNENVQLQQQNLFTDLNLLISDDEMQSNDDEIDEEQHDSCLENVNKIKFSPLFFWLLKFTFFFFLRSLQLNTAMGHYIINTIMIKFNIVHLKLILHR